MYSQHQNAWLQLAVKLQTAYFDVQARQQRVKAAEARLAKAEEEGDFIQTTHSDGLSQIKRGGCSACSCSQFTIRYRTCDADDPNVMLYCSACGCEAAVHCVDEVRAAKIKGTYFRLACNG